MQKIELVHPKQNRADAPVYSRSTGLLPPKKRANAFATGDDRRGEKIDTITVPISMPATTTASSLIDTPLISDASEENPPQPVGVESAPDVVLGAVAADNIEEIALAAAFEAPVVAMPTEAVDTTMGSGDVTDSDAIEIDSSADGGQDRTCDFIQTAATGATAADIIMARPEAVVDDVVGDSAQGDTDIAVLPKAKQAPTPFSNLQRAAEHCKSLRVESVSAATEEWGERSGAVLAGSLAYVLDYEAASKAEQDRVRTDVMHYLGMRRKPNEASPALTAIYLCLDLADKAATTAQRKEWSRFSAVVNVARHEGVLPAGAADWLKDKKQAALITQARQLKGKPIKAKGMTTLKLYPTLQSVLAASGSKLHKLALDELAKLEASLKAQSKTALQPTRNAG